MRTLVGDKYVGTVVDMEIMRVEKVHLFEFLFVQLQ